MSNTEARQIAVKRAEKWKQEPGLASLLSVDELADIIMSCDDECHEGDEKDKQIVALEARCAALEESKDEAYSERNKLVRLLASLYPSGLKATSIEGWDPDWHWCVYIDLPTGQASWHIHVSEYPNFSHLPNYEGEWDGHTTEEKYRRIAALTDNGGQG